MSDSNLQAQAERRLEHILRVPRVLSLNPTSSTSLTSSIGANRVELIPWSFSQPWFRDAPAARSTVKWMAQKESLSQDMFLVGTAGPLRRWFALHYCALKGREVEYLYLTRDSTESDLKQRREISSTGTSVYESQCVVEAALHGRVLILEGVENAERNVLPILNNLLENREMALESGEFLTSPQRYQFLREEAKKKGQEVSTAVQHLVPVHKDFRVIAISVPVPPLKGNPLDPPLRSRFQSRRIDSLDTNVLLRTILAAVGGKDRINMSTVQMLLSFTEAIRSLTSKQAALAGVENRVLAFQHLPSVSEIGLLSASQVLALFPETPVEDLLIHIYPWHVCIVNEEAREMVARIWQHMIRVSHGEVKDSHARVEEAQPEKANAKPAAPAPAAAPAAPTPTPSFQLNAYLARYLLTGSRRPGTLTTEDAQGVIGLNNPLPTDVVLKFQLNDPSEGELHQPSDATRNSSTVLVRCRGGSGSTSPTLVHPPVFPRSWTGGFLHHYALTAMLHSHIVGRDICVIGGKGEGKSYLVHQFAQLLGYVPLQTIFLYKDMTARDLIQRRTTTSTGATVWQDSPLVEALHTGGLAVLDGIDRLPFGTLSILDRLMLDRELQLFDGTRFLKHERYEFLLQSKGFTREQLKAKRIFPIHPSFRLIVLAALPEFSNPWLNHDVLHQFSFITYSLTSHQQLDMMIDVKLTGPSFTSHVSLSLLPSLAQVLLRILPEADEAFVQRMERFTRRIQQLSLDPVIQLEKGMLSLRQIIRIVKYEIQSRLTALSQVEKQSQPLNPQQIRTLTCEKIQNVLMLRYMPVSKRDVVHNVMVQVGLSEAASNANSGSGSRGDSEAVELLPISTEGSRLSIGDVSIALHNPVHPELVPDQFVFFNIPLHIQLMRRLIVDIQAGEHLCLIGNQGVGKNKITDRLLQLMRRERLYIQLHRDTTVSSLTLSPSLKEGKVVYEDSPLVLSMLHGYVFVIDEVDKAPMEVIVVLKALLEDGEVLLSDGRRFVSKKSPIYHLLDEVDNSKTSSKSHFNASGKFHRVHPNFFVIALANPPGFPFLGNDFFAQLGDVFACSAIDNPDMGSEQTLIAGYAPNVPAEIRNKLVSVFQELRQLNKEGILSYPYSTRELVNVVKHLQAFPNEPISSILKNILDFDSFDAHILQTLLEVFNKHGIVTQDLYMEQVSRLNGDVNASSRAGANLPVRLSMSFPLPPAQMVGSLAREDPDASFNFATFSASIIAAGVPVPLFAPGGFEAPNSPYLVDKAGQPLKHKSTAPAANATPAPSSAQALLDSAAARLEWKACDRHYSSRSAQFSEELYHFTHTASGVIPPNIPKGAAASNNHPLSASPIFVKSYKPGFVHFLTIRPFQLITYDLTSARPTFSVIHLTQQMARIDLVRFWVEEEFFAPVLLSIDSVKKLMVYVPQFTCLMLIDPFTPTVLTLTLNLDPARLEKNNSRFQDTQIPVLIKQLSPTGSVVAFIHKGSSKITLVDMATPELLSIVVEVSTSIKIHSFDVIHPSRLLLRDSSFRTYDCNFIGASWADALKSAAKTFGLERVEVSEAKLLSLFDPPWIDLSASFLSNPLPADKFLPSSLAQQHVQYVSTPTVGPQSKATGNWLAFGANNSSDAASSSSPSSFHLWQEEGLIAGYMVNYPVVSASSKGASSDNNKAARTPLAGVASRQTLATLFAHLRQEIVPPTAASSSNASSSSNLASPTSSIRMHTPSRTVSLFLSASSQELLTVLSFEREVVLELVDPRTASMRIISIPRPPRSGSQDFSVDTASEHHVVAAIEMFSGQVALLTRGGMIRVFELRKDQLQEQERAWRIMLGGAAQDPNNSSLNESGGGGGDISDDDGSSNEGNGEENGGDAGDPTQSGSGNGNGNGEGEGQGEGAGSGGFGGKGRGKGKGKGGGGGRKGGGGSGGGGMLSDLNFNRESKLNADALKPRPLDATKDGKENDPDAILNKAKELARAASGKILDPNKNRLGLEEGMYTRLYNAVAKEVSQLRVILEGAEAREQERVWLKNMVAGELDDNKLVDGSVGAKNIYKRRGVEENPMGIIQKKPKRLRFVMDVSSSMARFNSTDRRLDRMVATTVMIMEAFSGLGHKFDYSIVGHDGSSPLIPLVDFGHPPKTQKDRVNIIEMMLWNASFAESGDHTLAAAHHAINEVVKQEADDYFVFVLSDANLGGYGIDARAIANVLLANEKVHSYAIFIAGESQALPLTRMLPIGHGHVCTDTTQLPRIFKTIFAEALVANKQTTSKL